MQVFDSFTATRFSTDLNAPIMSIAVPIRAANGRLIAVLAAVTRLDQPNFLSKVVDKHYGQTGGYVITDGATFYNASTNFVIGLAYGFLGNATAGNNTVLVTNNATLISSNLIVGATVNIGSAVNSALNNRLLLSNATLTINGAVTVGDGSGGTATGNDLIIGGDSTATFQNLTVTNNNSLSLRAIKLLSTTGDH